MINSLFALHDTILKFWLFSKFPHFSLPNPPPPAATAMELVEPELTELLRREAGDDSPSPWGELYLMLTMGGAGFLGEGPNRLLKLMKWCHVTHMYLYTPKLTIFLKKFVICFFTYILLQIVHNLKKNVWKKIDSKQIYRKYFSALITPNSLLLTRWSWEVNLHYKVVWQIAI